MGQSQSNNSLWKLICYTFSEVQSATAWVIYQDGFFSFLCLRWRYQAACGSRMKYSKYFGCCPDPTPFFWRKHLKSAKYGHFPESSQPMTCTPFPERETAREGKKLKRPGRRGTSSPSHKTPFQGPLFCLHTWPVESSHIVSFEPGRREPF